jgi:signal transduction histidine kinase
MFKKLGAWIASIVRKELAEIAAVFGKDFEEQAKRAEADLAAIKAHVAQELANAKHELIGFTSTAALNLRGDAAKHTAALTEHAGKEGELARAAILDLRHFIAQEMAASYANIVKDAASAARLLEISKISQAICDDCHLASRRFAASRVDGRIVCAACAAKGNK